jgi:hypothetical protein
MLWSDEKYNWKIVFEHKVWADLHDNQLQSYRDYADKYFPEYTLVLITARTSQHMQNPDIALCWYEIAEQIQSLGKSESKNDWIRKEFISLLENNNLLDINPINPLSISYYGEVKRLDDQISSICNNSLKQSWNLLNNNDVKFELVKKVTRHWGRIGFEFVSPERDSPTYHQWEPSLFCGFFIDAKDHEISDLMPNGNPIVTVVLSCHELLHRVLPKNMNYKQFIIEMTEQLLTSNTLKHWSLSDRTQVEKSSNDWHPMIIHCQLDQFYKDASTIDNQEYHFFNQVNEVQSLILNCKSFKGLCDDVRQK